MVYCWPWVLSVLSVQQSGLLWLTLATTVAKHPARPATADVLTVFNGAWPVHCAVKAPLCLASCWKAPNVVLKSPVSSGSNDITSWLFCCNPKMIPRVHNAPADWWESGVVRMRKRSRGFQHCCCCVFFFSFANLPLSFLQDSPAWGGCKDHWNTTPPLQSRAAL